MNLIKKQAVFLFLLSVVSVAAVAQDTKTAAEKEAEYTKVINERADKIVTTLDIQDAKKATKVRDIIAGQYRNLNTIHDAPKESLKTVKAETKDNKEAAEAGVKKVEEDTNVKLEKLHKKYLSALSKQLSNEQVEKVKNGMTYNVFPNTYKAYQEMLPNLTTEQKSQIFAWLSEAREHAMDAESSEKKHGWFGKYKGKINNYLSAAGIDMRQAGLDWQARIKAAEEAKKN